MGGRSAGVGATMVGPIAYLEIAVSAASGVEVDSLTQLAIASTRPC